MILAFDCGSTFFKAALFDDQLNRLADASVKTPYTRATHTEVEMDAAQIWAAAHDLMKNVCDKARFSTQDITHFSLTSQAQTFGVFDGDGEAQSPIFSWMDKRATAESDEISRVLSDDFHAHCSFEAPSPQLQLSKVLWLKNNGFAEKLRRGFVWSLPTFLAWKIGGVALMDDNIAAMSGLYSLRENDWWSDALSLCKLQKSQLPRLVRVGEMLSTQKPCDDIAFSPDLKIVMAGNDQTSGAVGNNSESNQILVTLGTALVAYRLAGSEPGPYGTMGCWGPYPRGGYYELATRDEGCVALDWAREQLMPRADDAAFLARAQAAFRANKKTHFSFAPQQMRTEAAARVLSSVSEDAKDGAALAVLQGINGLVRELLENDLDVDLSRIQSITAIGGGSKFPFWRELLAHDLGCKVVQGSGDSLLGAAKIAQQN